MNPFKSLSEETRGKLLFLSLILFFPITGLILLAKGNRGCDFETIMDEWSVYLLFLCAWMFIAALIGFTILGIIYNLVETLIVIGIILGILFLFLGIPYIVYRITNLK